MSVLQDMLIYLRRPILLSARERFTPDACMTLFKLMGISLAVVFLSAILVGTVLNALGADMPNASDDFEKMTQSGSFVFLAIIVAPIIEEVLFRSWLGKSWGILFVMPLLLCGTAGLVLLGAGSNLGIIKLLGLMAVVGALGLYLQRYYKSRSVLNLHTYVAHIVFPYVFWGSVILFGAIHIGNYGETNLGILTPIIILPQLLVGAILGYVRMRFGLIAAIFFHGAYNGVMVTLMTLAPDIEAPAEIISSLISGL